MNFFTRQWATGELPDEDTAAIPEAYQAHLSALVAKMPATVRALAQGVSIHDGLLRGVVINRTQKTLAILMRCGDLQVGYFDLDIVYFDGVLDDGGTVALRNAAQDLTTEVLYDEIDVNGDGTWAHRILFWPDREVCIRFSGLGMNLEPRPDREFVRVPEIFIETLG